MRVVLSGRAERVDISNNFLSGLRNPGGIQFAGQPVGVQRPIDYFVHTKTPNYCTAIIAVQHPRLTWSSPIFGRICQRRQLSDFGEERRDSRDRDAPAVAVAGRSEPGLQPSRPNTPGPAISRVTPDQTICA